MPELLRFPRVIVLMILFSFLSIAAVVFTPAYPELTREFHLSSSEAQWVMTIFLFGTAIGRLPYGPIANRIGRRKTLFVGLWISMIGTAVILFSDSFTLLCFGRLIQALGCAVTLKIGYTMVGDLHAGAAATKVLSIAMLAYAILPGIATAVSGFLAETYGWRGGFWFFLAFNFCLILSCFCLPETLKEKDLNALKVKRILRGYAAQLRDPYLVLWSSLMGLSTAILFIFAQEAPFIAIEIMGMSAQAYGLMFLIPAFGIAGGSLLTAWLSDRISPAGGMLLGILVLLGGALLMGGLFLSHWVNGLALFLPQVLVQLGDAVLYTFASSSALSEAKDKSNASAIMLFINSMWGVLGTFLVGVLAPKQLFSLPVSFLIIIAMMLVIWHVLRSKRKQLQRL